MLRSFTLSSVPPGGFEAVGAEGWSRSMLLSLLWRLQLIAQWVTERETRTMTKAFGQDCSVDEAHGEPNLAYEFLDSLQIFFFGKKDMTANNLR